MAEKLGYHDVDDIPKDVFDDMVYSYSKAMSNCSNWSDVASDVIWNVLHDKIEELNISGDED